MYFSFFNYIFLKNPFSETKFKMQNICHYVIMAHPPLRCEVYLYISTYVMFNKFTE
jgi:hypothetical protein